VPEIRDANTTTTTFTVVVTVVVVLRQSVRLSLGAGPILNITLKMLPIILTLLLIGPSVSSLSLPAESLAMQLSLKTSTSMPYPTATQDTADAASFIKKQWNLSRGVIENGQNTSAIAFVNDPFPNSPAPGSSDSGSTQTSPVLQVTYPAGSYRLDTGGAQIYSLWNSSSTPFQTMLLSYEVAFDSGFNWVMGGKLPGLRGGIARGCSGGRQADGVNCFTSRTMWRTNGTGEGMLFFTYLSALLAQLSASVHLCSDYP
jgi:hypothetical protein